MLRLLLIQDKKPKAQTLERLLEKEGFAVDLALSGKEGNFTAQSGAHDVIILDLTRPTTVDLFLLRTWRKKGLNTPVLVLSARSSKVDEVQWLDQGADDYLTKPIQVPELSARLRALLRRCRQAEGERSVLRIHDLEIDRTRRKVRRAGQAINLSPNEFALLQFLAQHRGRVVSRSMILHYLYDDHAEQSSNLVDVYIRYLRTKIDQGFELPLIETRWGQGYLLRA